MFILEQALEKITQLWEEKQSYYVRNGLIFWASFPFSEYNRAVSVQVDGGNLIANETQSGRDLALSFEIFGLVSDNLNDLGSSDNLMISEFLSDCAEVITKMHSLKDNEGSSLFVEINTTDASFQTAYDQELRVQGVICTFTVKV